MLGASAKSNYSLFFAGLPLVITAWEPWRFELDVNYGFVENLGCFTIRKNGQWLQRASSQRQGWLIKGLVEYAFDWGVAGLFGWYASGDDGDVTNGSERLPSLAAKSRFTSFSGYGGLDWGVKKGFVEWQADYAGTWGIGCKLQDVSFLENLRQTLRIALWGGTNSPTMIKYMEACDAWNEGGIDNPYLTTYDYLLEFNLDNSLRIYDNLTLHLDLGYVVNMLDTATWQRSWMDKESLSCEKQDAWKAQLAVVYSF
ncbi:MAG: hypothetical protein K6G15_00610 [Desulfovibrio sp.]|nr:hypothetical protein [Desulfovibrio sp.]